MWVTNNYCAADSERHINEALKSQKGQGTDQKIVFTLHFSKSGLSALPTKANSWSSSPSLVTVKLMRVV